MRRTNVILFLFLSLFILLSMSASVKCNKTPSSEEFKAQKFPPCAACKILINSFKKVSLLNIISWKNTIFKKYVYESIYKCISFCI